MNKELHIPDGIDLNDLPTNGSKTEKPSLKDLARIDYTKELPPPEVALKVGGEIFGTLGNFSLVIGKAKSRKTFLMAMAMAGAIEPIHPFEGLLPKSKNKVVFVDTEQGEYHVIKVAQRVTRLSGEPTPANFEVYALRKFSTEERNIIIEEIINSTPDLGLLVIDGVRDIVTSINDEEQATGLANKLLKWTEERQIHIVTVLHQNKGDFNARGHIGTELINKAETTVSVTVERDDDVSKVEVEYSRNKAFQTFAFRVNEIGLPEVVDGWQPKSDTKKCVPHEMDEYKHTQILQKIARNISDRPSYSDISSQIIDAVTESEEYIGETKARQFFTYYLNNGFIQKHGRDRSPKAYYSVHPMGGNNG